MLKRAVLGICLTLLLSGTAAAVETTQETTVETLLKTSKSWDGEPLPEYPEGIPEITILRITIPGGVELPMHEHPVINAGVLLSGELTVITEYDEVLRLKAGDAISEVVNKWHYGKNEATEPAVIIVCYVGLEGEPVTILAEDAQAKHY